MASDVFCQEKFDKSKIPLLNLDDFIFYSKEFFQRLSFIKNHQSVLNAFNGTLMLK